MNNLLAHVYIHFYIALKNRVKKGVFRFVRKLPGVKGKIKSEVEKNAADMEKSFHDMAKGQNYIKHLPSEGLPEVRLSSLTSIYPSYIMEKAHVNRSKTGFTFCATVGIF